MTVQLPAPESGPPHTVLPGSGNTPATTRPSRARLIAFWCVAIVTCAALAAWLLAGLRPSLPPAGVTWQSPDLVGTPAVAGASDEDRRGTWTAWDTESGAWASVALHNPRPYPVTVAPLSVGNAVEVHVALYDSPVLGGLISPEYVTSAASVEVPSGGFVVVLIHVSDQCVELAAGTAVGSDIATVNVTPLGLTHSLDVPLPATYEAGTTTGHAADPSCASS